MRPALVCIPTFNERENIEAIVTAVLESEPRADVLVVDDNSPDGTGDLANALSAATSRVHVLHRPGREGLGRAYLAAFRWALDRHYELVLEMDADFSHAPADVPRLIDEALAGTDLVLGSRWVKGGGTVNWGVGRKALSLGGSLYARSILGLEIRDLTGGFKCFRRQVLESLDLDSVRSNGYSFQIEMTWRTIQKGFRVREIPIVFEDRRVGLSKMNRRIFVEALGMVWKLRLSK